MRAGYLSAALCGRTGLFPSAREFCSKVWRVGHIRRARGEKAERRKLKRYGRLVSGPVRLCGRKNVEVPTRYFVGTFWLIVDQLIASAKSGSTARVTTSSSFGLTLSGAAGSCRTVTCCPAISSVSSTS